MKDTASIIFGVVVLVLPSLLFADAKWANYLYEARGQQHPLGNLPRSVVRYADTSETSSQYDLSFHMNPYFLTGDIDGNGMLDYVIWVSNRETGEKGLCFYISEVEKMYVVGAGQKFGNGGADFSWANYWTILSKTKVAQSYWEPEAPNPMGDFISIGKADSASADIFWNGVEFVWYQSSD